MKRTPIARRTPLRNKAPMKRTSSRSRSPRRTKRSGTDIPPPVRAQVKQRSGGVCERCVVQRATDMHHRVPRSRGGPHDAFNLVHLCSTCHHQWAHGRNEYPWMIRGRFLRGVYVGDDPDYQAQYPAAA